MKIRIANVYSEILERESLDVVAEKRGRLYFGKLFFERVDEDVKDVLEEIELPDESSNTDIAKAVYPLYEKYGMLAKDGSTFSGTAHWAWVNGLVDTYEFNEAV